MWFTETRIWTSSASQSTGRCGGSKVHRGRGATISEFIPYLLGESNDPEYCSKREARREKEHVDRSVGNDVRAHDGEPDNHESGAHAIVSQESSRSLWWVRDWGGE